MIALIFVNESIAKLLDIGDEYKYTNNPFEYKDFHQSSNTSKCFRCIGPQNFINSSIYSEKDVMRLVFKCIYFELIYRNFGIFILFVKCEKLGLGHVFLKECTNVPDVFFFSVILYFCTFIMAISLKNIKSSSFFPAYVLLSFYLKHKLKYFEITY